MVLMMIYDDFQWFSASFEGIKTRMQANWGLDMAREVVRTLRLSCRGSLRVQIDFRPKFFECKEEASALGPSFRSFAAAFKAGTGQAAVSRRGRRGAKVD